MTAAYRCNKCKEFFTGAPKFRLYSKSEIYGEYCVFEADICSDCGKRLLQYG